MKANKLKGDAKPQPIQLDSQEQLGQANSAMIRHIARLKDEIEERVKGRVECDTIESLRTQLADAEAAYDHIRRAF